MCIRDSLSADRGRPVREARQLAPPGRGEADGENRGVLPPRLPAEGGGAAHTAEAHADLGERNPRTRAPWRGHERPRPARGCKLYRRPPPLHVMDIRAKQRAVVEALEDVKGRDIIVFNTARMPSMFERVVIASGDSNRQVRALADRVQERIRELGSRVYGVEGEKSGDWVLVDLGDVVVHIMHPAVREFYNLEEVWGGKTVRLINRKKPKQPRRAKAKRPRGKR